MKNPILILTVLLGLLTVVVGCSDTTQLPTSGEEPEFQTSELHFANLGVAQPGEMRAPSANAGFEISKGQTKFYWLAPAGCLQVYYRPHNDAPSYLEARTALWQYWLDEQAPQVSIDIFCSSGLPGDTWNWMCRLDVKPWWRRSLPLFLNRGVYKFEVRSSDLALVTLRIK